MSTSAQRTIDLAVRAATECKSIRTLLNGNSADLSMLTTTAKTSLVAALNELKANLDTVAASIGAQIDDAAVASTSKTWSVTKISNQIAAAVNSVISSAPGALDTLDELAAALGDDANFAANITTALSNRLRIDIPNQGLTAQQKLNGCTNLGIGDPDTNFVTSFEGGL
ncbi:hypothetical protein [Asticcacaulis machinosus]|uniref:Uncharacterized protein n=1 Tax=Asticcacaulis machinosus TaxID=2984211 RepID=A0ABT5HGJ4_9CAUL|nr:hypothetical protein [Asticcacaulis machinosus]MDC7675376.1 hypothetical protein [Asticcacaulis machinosus]